MPPSTIKNSEKQGKPRCGKGAAGPEKVRKRMKLDREREGQIVRDWVARAPMRNAYLWDFFARGAELLQSAPDALVLYDRPDNICFAAGTGVECPQLHTALLVLTDERSVADRLADERSHNEFFECLQALYLRPEPAHAECPGMSVRMLTMDDLGFVLENYHNPGAYEKHIRGRIAEGMLGAVVDGELAGFAGVHQEGSMGLLEVLSRFRRRGIGEALECEVINLQRSRGRLPYCHVETDNQASMALQRKLGLTIDEQPLYWVG